MLIDWFTVGAQVINFLVLVVVLKLVLFDRVVAAMDRREAAIAERINEAEAREVEARTEADRYRAQQEELAAERRHRIEQAEADAAARRSELLDEAHAHVGALRDGWEEALARDRTHLLEEVRRRTGEQVCIVARRALADLADADLEAQLVRVAIRRMTDDAEQLQPLVAEHRDSHEPVVVSSRFSLPEDLATELTKALMSSLGCTEDEVLWEREPELVCGLQVRSGAWSVGWSVDGYLDSVVDELESLLPAREDDTG